MLAIGLWARREAREPIAVGDGDKEAHEEIVNNGQNLCQFREKMTLIYDYLST